MNERLHRIDRVFKLVNREVWIVTSAHDGERAGLTATWVSQASIDPEHPLVVVGLAPNHRTAEVVEAGGAFGLHLLLENASALAHRFGAASSRETDKFDGLDLTTGPCGSPILANSAAWLDCRVVARYSAGDRLFFWGKPHDGEAWSEGLLLREQEFIQSLTNEQLLELSFGREADIKLHRPLRQAWLRES